MLHQQIAKAQENDGWQETADHAQDADKKIIHQLQQMDGQRHALPLVNERHAQDCRQHGDLQQIPGDERLEEARRHKIENQVRGSRSPSAAASRRPDNREEWQQHQEPQQRVEDAFPADARQKSPPRHIELLRVTHADNAVEQRQEDDRHRERHQDPHQGVVQRHEQDLRDCHSLPRQKRLQAKTRQQAAEDGQTQHSVAADPAAMQRPDDDIPAALVAHIHIRRDLIQPGLQDILLRSVLRLLIGSGKHRPLLDDPDPHRKEAFRQADRDILPRRLLQPMQQHILDDQPQAQDITVRALVLCTGLPQLLRYRINADRLQSQSLFADQCHPHVSPFDKELVRCTR